MMWFFPIKVQEQQDRIAQKKVELELYKNIITNPYKKILVLMKIDY